MMGFSVNEIVAVPLSCSVYVNDFKVILKPYSDHMAIELKYCMEKVDIEFE